MKRSLATRLYRSIFAVSLITIALVLLATEYIDDGLEQAILEKELIIERDYFLERIEEGRSQSWRQPNLDAFFVPDAEPENTLPIYLQNLTLPFAEEVETGEETYLVVANRVDEAKGTLFVSRDISVMESQEIYSTMTLMTVALVIALVSFVLSYINARQLVRPLKRLTHRIHQTEPGKSMARLETDYKDTEFVEIAEAFNRFLSELEAFVGREKSFVKLASHELRSPLAVIAGALEIIEKRNQLSQDDQYTLARIRRASRNMQADVDVLLRLARGETEPGNRERVNIERSIRNTLADLESTQPEQVERIIFDPHTTQCAVTADPALVRMLIRNLVQNALTHTRSAVRIDLSNSCFRVSDAGKGLPQPVLKRLSSPLARQPEAMQESSFGLLIVQLICERLAWRMDVARSDDTGTAIEIRFLG